MAHDPRILVQKIEPLLGTWQDKGLPGRTTLLETANALIAWRAEKNIPGLWPTPPLMIGATLDDAWGMGIELILKYAAVVGVETKLLGILVPWREILAACKTFQPDYLGLTVLHFETEDDLTALGEHLPAPVKIIAGGPVFRSDPDYQQRAKIDVVAKDLSAFLRFLINTTTK